uniref:Serpin B6 n=1 Tax=Hucho hucho TaxID=62062 RepID=A0A4W5PY19_9TELE
MMKITFNVHLTFIPDINFQILEMPYEGSNVSMLIMLPEEKLDFTTGLEKQLIYENFAAWTGPVRIQYMEARTYNLNDILFRTGIVDTLDWSSDFSGMSPDDDLELAGVVKKAFVEVNKQCTKATAITAIDTFKANHPFLFFIRHNDTQKILFCANHWHDNE